MSTYIGRMIDILAEELERLENELKSVVHTTSIVSLQQRQYDRIEAKATMISILALAFPSDRGFKFVAEDANKLALEAEGLRENRVA